MMETTIAGAVPFFFLSIFLELGFSKWKKLNLYRAEDTLSNLALGTFQQMIGMITKSYVVVIYAFAQSHFQFFTLPTHTPFSAFLSWSFAFLAVDFAYYWFHRKAHEVNLLWASHVAHHSSEEYNLSVALRQSALQSFFSIFFYIPLVLFGITWEMFGVCFAFNLIYQFFIHTRAIKNLGPLETLLNTPSHHRVHHGRNLKYMDKNHAGVFIIWDKWFGTFVPEEETPTYGITTPLKSYNPFWATVHHLVFILGDLKNSQSFTDAWKTLFYAPGWRPKYLGGPIKPKEPKPNEIKFYSSSTMNQKIGAWILFVLALGVAIFLMNAQAILGEPGLSPNLKALLAISVALLLTLSGTLLTGNPHSD